GRRSSACRAAATFPGLRPRRRPCGYTFRTSVQWARTCPAARLAARGEAEESRSRRVVAASNRPLRARPMPAPAPLLETLQALPLALDLPEAGAANGGLQTHV